MRSDISSMNIRSIGKIIDPLSHVVKEASDKVVKSDSTTDRDGNGQMAQGDSHHPPMSDEQFKKAIEHLKKLAVVKERNLSVEVSFEANGQRFVMIKEKNGKLFRKISESELWSLIQTKDNEKGQLISKTA